MKVKAKEEKNWNLRHSTENVRFHIASRVLATWKHIFTQTWIHPPIRTHTNMTHAYRLPHTHVPDD